MATTTKRKRNLSDVQQNVLDYLNSHRHALEARLTVRVMLTQVSGLRTYDQAHNLLKRMHNNGLLGRGEVSTCGGRVTFWRIETAGRNAMWDGYYYA